jgi:uncharacterized protein (DUF58 family)
MMSRVLIWGFVLGLVVLIVGLFVSATSSVLGSVLVVVGAVGLAGVAVVANLMARRPPDWTAPCNPGGSRRKQRGPGERR